MLPFTIKQLEIFNAVAEQLSFTIASRVLHLTQPALSQQINNLETQCGKMLFEQIGKKIYLTEAGKTFQEKSKKIIEQLHHLKSVITEENTEVTGTLVFCISNGLQHRAFELINRFCKQHPKVTFKVSIGDGDFALSSLNQNKIDFCLSSKNVVNKTNVVSELITTFPVSLVASCHNPITKKKNLHIESLVAETFIVGGDVTTCYDVTHKIIKKLKIPTNKIIQIKNLEAVKYATHANLGIAFLPNSLILWELKEKLLVSLSLKNLSSLPCYEMHWVQHVNKSVPLVARRFKEFLFHTSHEKIYL